MVGSLISGVGQGATGFAQLAGAFDPNLPRRNINTEVKQTLGTSGQIFRNAQRWQPRYDQLNRGVMNSALFGGAPIMNEQTPGYAEMLTNLFSYLGPKMMEAQRATNPEAFEGLDALLKAARQDFENGYELSPAELRNLQQGMRSAQAARGFGFSPADAGAESLAQLQAGMGLRQQRFGNLSSALAQHHAQTPNPFGVGQSLMGFGMGASQAAADRLVDPFSAYAADLHNTNFNAKAYEELATIQNRKEAAQNITAGAAAIGGASMGGLGGGAMGGALGGAAGGAMGGSAGGGWFSAAPAYGAVSGAGNYFNQFGGR